MTAEELIMLVNSIAGDLWNGSARMPVDVSPKAFIASKGDDGRGDIHLWEDIPSPATSVRACANALVAISLVMRTEGRTIEGAALVYPFEGNLFVTGKTPAGLSFVAWSPIVRTFPGNRATLGRFTFDDLVEGSLDDGDPLDVLYVAATQMRDDVVAAFQAQAGELVECETVAEPRKRPSVKRYVMTDWGDV